MFCQKLRDRLLESELKNMRLEVEKAEADATFVRLSETLANLRHSSEQFELRNKNQYKTIGFLEAEISRRDEADKRSIRIPLRVSWLPKQKPRPQNLGEAVVAWHFANKAGMPSRFDLGRFIKKSKLAWLDRLIWRLTRAS